MRYIILLVLALNLMGCPDYYTPYVESAKRAYPDADDWKLIRDRRGYYHLVGWPIQVRKGEHYFIAVCHEHACTRIDSAAMESD